MPAPLKEVDPSDELPVDDVCEGNEQPSPKGL